MVSAFSLSDSLNWFSGRNAWGPGTSEATPNTVEGSQPLSAPLTPGSHLLFQFYPILCQARP